MVKIKDFTLASKNLGGETCSPQFLHYSRVPPINESMQEMCEQLNVQVPCTPDKAQPKVTTHMTNKVQDDHREEEHNLILFGSIRGKYL